ncbi:hypothetical protein D3C72_672570 [compost metagenome]
MDNENFLIYKFPKGNMNDPEGRAKYFDSKIVCKANINKEAQDLITKDMLDINFPFLYRRENYKDLYPTFYAYDHNIVYTFQYWDSIAFIKNGLKERYPIPNQFSVSAEPILEEYLSSKIKSEEYFFTHNANIKLLNFKGEILVFQQIGAEKYVNEETGMLNDYLSLDKRMLVFDLDKQRFEDVAYKLPPNCNPVKSCVFNNHLYLFASSEARRKIRIYITTLK